MDERALAEGVLVATMGAASVEDFKSGRALSESEALRLRYLYEVDGRMYSSTRIFFGDDVTIRYDPRDPEESVIDTGNPATSRMLKFGVSLVAAAPFVYWAHVHTRSLDSAISSGVMGGLIGSFMFALRPRDYGPMDKRPSEAP